MHNDLILSAFTKAIDSLEEKGVVSPSKSSAAELLSDFIEAEMDFQFGERRLRDYYNSVLKEERIEIKQQPVRDGLSLFLGSSSFENWLLKTNRIVVKSEATPKEFDRYPYFTSNFLKRNRNIFLVSIGCILLFLTVNSFNTEKWMEWEGKQFVEADFDGHKVEKGQLLVHNQTRMEGFKRIDPNCDTQFFNVEGNAQLWYGKNLKGELQYFTDLGRHPETRKTLKPITKYMVRKYICQGGK